MKHVSPQVSIISLACISGKRLFWHVWSAPFWQATGRGSCFRLQYCPNHHRHVANICAPILQWSLCLFQKCSPGLTHQVARNQTIKIQIMPMAKHSPKLQQQGIWSTYSLVGIAEKTLTLTELSWLEVASVYSLSGCQSRPWILERWAAKYSTAVLGFCKEKNCPQHGTPEIWSSSLA